MQYYCWEHLCQRKVTTPQLIPEEDLNLYSEARIGGRFYVVKFCGNSNLYHPSSNELKGFLDSKKSVLEWHPEIQWQLFADAPTLFLDALFFALSSNIRRINRSPELLVYDVTYKTNNRDYAVTVPCGSDANNNNLTWGLGLLSGETQSMTTFILETALPLLYGHVLDRVRLIISDDGPGIVPIIESVVKNRLYGLGFGLHF